MNYKKGQKVKYNNYQTMQSLGWRTYQLSDAWIIDIDDDKCCISLDEKQEYAFWVHMSEIEPLSLRANLYEDRDGFKVKELIDILSKMPEDKVVTLAVTDPFGENSHPMYVNKICFYPEYIDRVILSGWKIYKD